MNLLKSLSQSKIIITTLIILIFLFTYLLTKTIKQESIYNINKKQFVGIIIKKNKTDYGYSLTIKSLENLVVYIENCPYDLGDLVKITGNLEELENNTILNNFNYKEYLKRQKIFYVLAANDIKLIKKNTNIIYKLKLKILNYLNKFKSSIYLNAFLIGDTSYLKDIYNSYQINGISHLLSIGSTHIIFLSYILHLILKKTKLEKIYPYIFSLLILLFLILTNYPISIIRTVLYMLVSFICKRFNIKISSYLKFLLVTIIPLIINPFNVYNKGMLYSYYISYLLIFNSKKITGNKFLKLFKVSFISFLGSIPLNIYFNYEFNALSIIYNLIYVPVFNLLVFPLAILTFIFPFFDNIFYFLMNNLTNFSFFLNKIDLGIIILKKINVFYLILYSVLIILIVSKLLNKKYKYLFLLLITILIHYNINNIVSSNYFMFLDVKQGDSSLFYSNNKTVLIDTGGVYNKNITENTILMLKSLGIRKIDYLFLTHGDYDHMGDSIYFVDNFKVLNVIFNSNNFNELESSLIKKLKSKKINYNKSYQDTEYIINDIKIKSLNKDYENENDSSLVLYIIIKDIKILMMGDASKKVEMSLLDKYNLKNIDFLKVGHHGSKTSSSKYFIDDINPKYSVISVGKNNRYGHPNDIVLSNLKNSKIFRTDKDGSIVVTIKKKLKLETLPP